MVRRTWPFLFVGISQLQSSLAEELTRMRRPVSAGLAFCRPALKAAPQRSYTLLRAQWLSAAQSLPVLELSAALRLHGGSTSGASLSLQSLKTPLAFLGWYAMSIVYSLLNKEVLEVWKFPCTSAAVQLLVGSLWIGLMWTPLPTLGLRPTSRLKRLAPLRAPPRLTGEQLREVGRVAVWLALGHVLSTVAPAYGTVAFTNVVKTLEPLFTCLFSAVLLRQIFSARVYLSLLPVIGGVAVASASEISFSSVSLLSGLLSNVCFALRAISAKRLMSQPVGENMHAQNLYAVLTMLALVAILPLALAIEGPRLLQGTADTIAAVGAAKFGRMLLLCGLSHYLYNECAFVALSSIHPVSHAVANTIKRIAVIVVSVRIPKHWPKPIAPAPTLSLLTVPASILGDLLP